MPEDWVQGDEELLANFDALIEVMESAIVQAGLAGADVVVQAANAKAPGPHNVVQIDKVSPEHVELRIGPDKDHWFYRFFERGTQPHEIGLKNRQALRFGAEPIFARSGEHPGMAAQPFLRPAIDEKRQAVLDAMGRVYWDRIRAAIR